MVAVYTLVMATPILSHRDGVVDPRADNLLTEYVSAGDEVSKMGKTAGN